MTRAEIEKLVDTLHKFSGTYDPDYEVSHDAAMKILGDLAAMKYGSKEVFNTIIVDLSGFAYVTQNTQEEAAKRLVEAFDDPFASMEKLEGLLGYLSEADRESIKEGQESLRPTAAIAAVLVKKLHAVNLVKEEELKAKIRALGGTPDGE